MGHALQGSRVELVLTVAVEEQICLGRVEGTAGAEHRCFQGSGQAGQTTSAVSAAQHQKLGVSRQRLRLLDKIGKHQYTCIRSNVLS